MIIDNRFDSFPNCGLKICSYIAQYPVRWSAQSTLNLTLSPPPPSPTDMFIPTQTLGSIHATITVHIFSTVYRPYSFIQLDMRDVTHKTIFMVCIINNIALGMRKIWLYQYYRGIYRVRKESLYSRQYTVAMTKNVEIASRCKININLMPSIVTILALIRIAWFQNCSSALLSSCKTTAFTHLVCGMSCVWGTIFWMKGLRWTNHTQWKSVLVLNLCLGQ